jgi:hypothetical protein
MRLGGCEPGCIGRRKPNKRPSIFSISLLGEKTARKILSWPPAGLDPQRLSPKMQVIRIIFRTGAKAMHDGTLARERDRARVLAALLRRVQELDRVD